MKIGTFKDKATWLEWRKGKIGASDAPAIMGYGYRSALELYNEFLGQGKPVFETENMRYGHDMEETLLKKAEAYAKCRFEPQVCFVSDLQSQIIATCDGVAVENGEIILAELKCRSDYDTIVDLPIEINMQVQQQMHCSDAIKTLVVIAPMMDKQNREPKFFWVERDEAFWEDIFEREMRFLRCVEQKTPPKPYRWAKETSSDRLSELAHLWQELQLTEEERRKLKRLEEVEAELKQYAIQAGDSVSVGSVVLQYSEAKGTVDYGKIPQLKGVNLDDYRKDPIKRVKIIDNASK